MVELLVVPRARSPVSGCLLPLTDIVGDIVREHTVGAIAIIGPPGSGKTTAARYVEEQLDGVHVEDDAQRKPRGDSCCFYTACRPLAGGHAVVLQLEPWGRDERIEYLLARHPAECTSVMDRIDDPDLAGGNAELWSTILDTLATQPRVRTVRAALRLARSALGRHAPVRLLARADRVIALLRRGVMPRALCKRLSRRLIDEVARQVDADCRATLGNVPVEGESAAASILVRVDPDWRPNAGAQLRRADLICAVWPGVNLQATELRDADLRGADLREALLDAAQLMGAQLDGACLDGANLGSARMQSSSLVGASLVCAIGRATILWCADLRRARVEGASLREASLLDAVLDGASFVAANLTHARLDRATVRGANFAEANLAGASVREVKMYTASWEGARFSGARLSRSHFDGMDLSGSRFDGATLKNASLTDARMRGCNLRGASLFGARAGNVDWQDADLRDADLRFVNFHMGSSRSGLVDSSIASEGSRTGFYTDEYEERAFKAPEEIRKANLRGADLRGASIGGTDFYLVDLRDAHYTAKQALVFRRDGAIL